MNKILLTLLLPAIMAISAEVQLEWDPNPEPDVTSYRVYWGGSSKNYTNHVQVSAPSITATVSNLTQGVTYCFAATAINAAGLESEFSNEVAHTIPKPPSAPGGLKITTTIQASSSLSGPWTDLASYELERSITSQMSFFRATIALEETE